MHTGSFKGGLSSDKGTSISMGGAPRDGEVWDIQKCTLSVKTFFFKSQLRNQQRPSDVEDNQANEVI